MYPRTLALSVLRNVSYSSLALLFALPAHSQSAPIPLDEARDVIAIAEGLRRPELTALWGLPLACPLLLADPATRRVVATVADTAGVLQSEAGLFVGTLPEEIGIANTSLLWGGRRWTMLMWPLPARVADRARLLGHELFHCLQPALGIPAADPVNAHLDTRDGRTWLRMEWRALEEALVQRGAERRVALEDALAFRAWRRRLVPGAADTERALEWNEGSAEYTGFRASGRPPHVLADRAAVALAQWESRPSFSRGFAYASGPAWGILLDESGARWREAARNGADLGELAAEAHGIQVAEPTREDVTARGERYQYQQVEREEDSRAARAVALAAEHERRFVTGPVVRIVAGGEFGYTFNPNTVQSFRDGTVLPSGRITDEWGTLEVTANGVWLVREGGLITGIVLPAPAGRAAPVEGDGWTLRLNPGWTLVPGSRPGDWVVRREE